MRRLADCSRWTPALLVLALALPGVADARKKNPYEGKLYNGQTIEGYCAGLLGVEAFDLTDEDLAICDKRYSQELDALDDITLGDIQLDGDGPRRSEVLEEEAEPREPKVSKKELEERRLAEEEAKRKKMDDLGLVEFEEEAPADDGGDDDDEEDDDEFDEKWETIIKRLEDNYQNLEAVKTVGDPYAGLNGVSGELSVLWSAGCVVTYCSAIAHSLDTVISPRDGCVDIA